MSEELNSEPDGAQERSPASLTREELISITRMLEQIADQRGVLLQLDRDEQARFLKAAGQVAHPGRAAKRDLVRAARQLRKQQKLKELDADNELLERTGIRLRQSISARKLTGAPPKPLPLHPTTDQASAADQVPGGEPGIAPNISGDQVAEEQASPAADEVESSLGNLRLARNCYICKKDFQQLHSFYDSMCPKCAAFNWKKRQQTADLEGRYALLTGGRVKIGFEAALKLLRAGAHVIVSTRFPRDAASRFAAQDDSSTWLDRLSIFGLDMRHTPSVESFAQHLLSALPRLDFILNNACQTVRRPSSFYRHMLAEEQQAHATLPLEVQCVLESYQQLVESSQQTATIASASLVDSGRPAVNSAHVLGEHNAPELSQVPLLPEDLLEGGFFPEGRLDRDLQQVDLRKKNSWRLKLDEVTAVELLEVHLVNAVAPFILNARLKPLMSRTPGFDQHIVNVSAMEGVFYRAFKRDTHPHTNMAKAALNMMTRTSAADYVRDGIHMNSVDTGWITDEDPIEITERKKEERGFSTPLDTVDAAARICDPIFDGINTGNHVWGKFLKDYQVSNW